MALIKLSKDDNTNSSTVDEFSSHSDIQESDLEPEDLVVEELSDGSTKLRERKEGEHVVKVNPNSEYARKMLSDDEIEELQEKHEVVTGESTETPTLEEVYQGMKEDIARKNRETAKLKMEQEIESAREEMKEHIKYGTPVNELQGSEFQELIQEANGDESPEPEGFAEVKEQIREKYSGILEDSEPDIKDPNDAVENLSEATDAFREYAEKEGSGVWEEMAKDVQDSDGQTEYTTVDENSRRVRTKDPELRDAIVNHENEPFDGDVTIHERGSEYVEATIKKND